MGAEVAEQKIAQVSLDNAAMFCILDILSQYRWGERLDFTWHSPATSMNPPDLSYLGNPRKATLHFQTISKVKLLC